MMYMYYFWIFHLPMAIYGYLWLELVHHKGKPVVLTQQEHMQVYCISNPPDGFTNCNTSNKTTQWENEV